MRRYTFCDSWYNRRGELVEKWYDRWDDEYVWDFFDDYGYIGSEYEFDGAYV